MARQKLIHLHGAGELTTTKAREAEIKLGEIAVRHQDGNSELYVVTDETTGKFDKFINAAVIESNLSGAITTLKNNEIKGLADRIAAFEEGGANSVEGQIESAITALTGATGQVGKNKAAIETLTQDLGELSGELDTYKSTNDKTVKDNADAIAKLNGDASTAGSVAKAVADGVKGLADGQVTTNKNAIATLNGTGEGSVAKAVADGVKGLADGQVATNKNAIATLNGTGEGSVKKAVKDLADGQVTTNKNAIATLNGDANTAGSVAKTVADAVSALEQGAVKDNADALTTHKNDTNVHVSAELQEKWNTTSNRLETFLGGDTLQDTLDTLHGIQEWMDADGKNASDILGAITQEAEDRKDADDNLSARIAAFETGSTSVGTQIESAITALTGATGQVGKNKAAIETLNGTGAGSVTKTVSDAVKELADGQVTTNKNAIAILNGDASTTGSVAKAVKDLADGQVTTNKNAIATLNGTGAGSVTKTVSDAVKELADGQVTTNKNAIAILNGDASTTGSVKKAVKDLADGQVTTNKNAIATLNGNANTAGSVAKAVSDAVTSLKNTEIKNITDNFVNSGEIKGANNQVINGTVTSNKLSFDITGLVIDCGTY